ncbi:MAG: type II toxin-antitoxin system HicA family toxin [Deltaproteobacteria bacterium]|nr:type II toxin-antitoxin system HicA family toxin [Deltaproteobacteria bacterium]
MPGLSPVSFNELVKRLREFGFEGPYGGGKHLYMTKEDLRLTVPNPHRKEIGVDLLMRILRQAGITKEKWLKGN